MNEAPDYITVVYIFFFPTYFSVYQPYAIGHDLLLGI